MQSGQDQPSLHLLRYVWVQCFVSELQAKNASYVATAAKAKLPVMVEQPSELVVKRPVFKFVGESAKAHGMPLLGLKAARRACVAGPGRALTAAVANTLAGNLRDLIAAIHAQANNIAVGLKVTGRGACLWHRGLGPASELAGPAEQMELLILGLFTEKIRSCLGAAWQPRCVNLQATTLPAELREEFPCTRINVGADTLEVWLSLDELSRTITPRQQPLDHQEDAVPVDFPGSLRAALVSAFSESAERPVSLALASEFAGISSRSVQRRLAESGLTFRDVYGDALVASSSRYLRDAGVAVNDVAACHGYSNTSHFIRAFKRSCGVSPGRYQRLAAAGAI